MIKNTCLSHLIILVDRFPYYLLWVILILKKIGSITHPGYVQGLNWGPGPWSVPSLVDPWTWCTSVAWRIPTREPQLSQHGTPKSMVLFQKWSPILDLQVRITRKKRDPNRWIRYAIPRCLRWYHSEKSRKKGLVFGWTMVSPQYPNICSILQYQMQDQHGNEYQYGLVKKLRWLIWCPICQNI